VGNIIPAGRINPTSQFLLQFIPLPTKPTALTNNFIKASSTGGNVDEYVGRVDQNINASNRVFGRFSYWKLLSLAQDPFGTGLCKDRCAENTRSKSLAIGVTHTFSPTTIADFNISISRFHYLRLPINSAFDMTQEGWPAAYNALVPDTERTPLTPCFGVSDTNITCSQGQSSINDFNTQSSLSAGEPLQIVPEMQFLYNPELRGAPNFVPGVMALVLMLVCTMMTSVAIVKEKELGTMEVLLVSPFKPIYIIISKLTPNLLISVVNLFIILLLSAVFLDLHVKGSLLLLVFCSTLFVLTSLSIGLLLSINAKTQQAAMMASLMGMMLPTMLLTGFLFPIENMPLAMQWLSNLVPSRWYFIIVKRVMLKGLGFGAVWKETLILAGMSLLLFAISLRRFKIRLQ